MNFYEKLSTVYDTVFSYNENTHKLLRETLNLSRGERFLDVACGTGTYSLALNKDGFSGCGVDLDNKMIEIAKTKSNELNNLGFNTMDMREINLQFHNTFNLIYCIGNSLVHLSNALEIEKAINDFYSILQENGYILIQIINYDRILKNNIKNLPTIQKDNVDFVRNYDYKKDENKIYFNTELRIQGDTNVYKGSTPLIPLKSKDLINIIKKCGFKDIEVFGDFKKSVFNIDSYGLIIRACK
ncbi:class I SAM-dependent methyltransferase [Clostridium frigidicarnis]|uniref:Ubiquinone/menaquinone biosynthesis C-methylase UbiE n=1 Tax=Clostridium frigidicarnis TaxID=84698 RepID=A0A1I0UZ25_9CLOT|nr:class I SAM-dependent methyltransferase [Clostridium frigidicarnis]SFA69288.1 Ubiquinone/menaquinone biosynthesis C-methylase UbiE [Clostridium frigidicarnis]